MNAVGGTASRLMGDPDKALFSVPSNGVETRAQKSRRKRFCVHQLTRSVSRVGHSATVSDLCAPQPAKLDLNKKSLTKQKTIQNFTIDARGFRKTRNENPPTQEIGVTS